MAQAASGPALCAAVRGNGELIWAHFASLARVLEQEGLVGGIAGGSSASITSFLYESILANAEIRRGCAAGTCGDAEVAKRAAFLLKSTFFWMDVVGATKEGQALTHMWTIKDTLHGFDVTKLTSDDIKVVAGALKALHDLLASSTARDLINKEFLHFIFNGAEILDLLKEGPKLLRYRAAEARKAVEQFGSFDASSPAIFVRPGLIDFRQVGALIGNIADFYAAYLPGQGDMWQDMFKKCTEESIQRLPWDLEGTPCRASYSALVAAFLEQRSALTRHRIGDSIGRYMPVAVTTATLVQGGERFKQAKTSYDAGNGSPLNLTANDFRFGYAGPGPWLATISANIQAFPDLRSRKFMYLGAMAWGDLLAVSPAEPGLANAQPFGAKGEYYSFGGWSDLSPVNVLVAGECGKIVYLTRQGEDSQFAKAIAAQVGFAATVDDLFSTQLATSSLHMALERADEILCTNWNAYSGFSKAGIQDMMKDAYFDATLWGRNRAAAPIGCH